MFIYILGMGADDDLILAAGLDDLNNAGHLFNFLSNGFVGVPLQNETKSGSAMCCSDNVAFTKSILDVGCQFGIVADFLCHDSNSSSLCFPQSGDGRSRKSRLMFGAVFLCNTLNDNIFRFIIPGT